MGACLSWSVRGPTFMSEQGTQNQALEQTRDSVLRYGEVVGCELLNFVVLPMRQPTVMRNGAEGLTSQRLLVAFTRCGGRAVRISSSRGSTATVAVARQRHSIR